MAIAGRVAIVPKGEWSQSVTYDKLDLVTYNGNTFIAYKSSVGVTPVDGDTWMLILEGVDPQDIDNIIDGTTPVGNALQLDGKGASEYILLATALATFLGKNTSRLGDIGFDNTNKLYITIDEIVYHIPFTNAPSGANTFNGTATGNLPLTGGKISAYSTVPLELQSTNSDDTLIMHMYNRSDSAIGSIGFRLGLPTLRIGTGAWQEILHTGNKPTGTYTGTGASRTVEIGGIGKTVAIHSTNGVAYVSYEGPICKTSAGTSVTGLNWNDAYFNSNGTLVLSTADPLLNASGVVYTYELL